MFKPSRIGAVSQVHIRTPRPPPLSCGHFPSERGKPCAGAFAGRKGCDTLEVAITLERVLDVWKVMTGEKRRLYHYRVVDTLDLRVSTQT